MRRMLSFCGIISVVLLMSACASQKNPPTPSSPEDIQAMMIEAATPAAEHKFLDPIIGTWKATSHWKMNSVQEAMVSTGLSKKQWVLNNLYVQENYEDKNSQYPFVGLGMLGFDKVAQHFTSSWFDSMSTINWISTGTALSDGKTILFQQESYCPIAKDLKTIRSELEIVNDKQHFFRMFDHDESGREFISLEIEYQRVK